MGRFLEINYACILLACRQGDNKKTEANSRGWNVFDTCTNDMRMGIVAGLKLMSKKAGRSE